MPDASTERASVLNQLKAAGVLHARVFAGLPLRTHPEQEVAAIELAASQCLIPPSYAAEANVSARWLGTVGSSLAHLQLLRHVWQLSTKAHPVLDRCRSAKWALVLADDVALQPGFSSWVADVMEAVDPKTDLVNLAAVRAWGARVETSPVLRRMVGALSPWPPWASSRPGVHHVKNPNLLVRCAERAAHAARFRCCIIVRGAVPCRRAMLLSPPCAHPRCGECWTQRILRSGGHPADPACGVRRDTTTWTALLSRSALEPHRVRPRLSSPIHLVQH